MQLIDGERENPNAARLLDVPERAPDPTPPPWSVELALQTERIAPLERYLHDANAALSTAQAEQAQARALRVRHPGDGNLKARFEASNAAAASCENDATLAHDALKFERERQESLRAEAERLQQIHEAQRGDALEPRRAKIRDRAAKLGREMAELFSEAQELGRELDRLRSEGSALAAELEIKWQPSPVAFDNFTHDIGTEFRKAARAGGVVGFALRDLTRD